MQITLTEAQEALVRRAVDSGRLAWAEDAVAEALLLWEEQQRAREALVASIEAERRAIARGEGIEITPGSLRSLTEDVKRRGRERRGAVG